MGKRKPKLPLTEQTAEINSLSHEGRGVAQVDGKTTFIFGALPEETVNFRYTKKRGKFDEGNTTEVIIASKNRVPPKCQHFGICGGCSVQHMTHELQLEYKQNTFLNLLKHQAALEPKKILPPLTANTWGYRRKARLGVKYVIKKEKVLVGFHERAGRYVADINQCEVLHSSVGQRIYLLGEFIQTLDTFKHIRQLEVAITDDETGIIIRHMQAFSTGDLEKLQHFARQQQLKIYLQSAGPDSIELFFPKHANPLLSYQLEPFQLTLEFHPAQFTQINAELNNKMIQQAIKLLQLTPSDHVLDLFCGIGNFSLPIAQQCQQVTAIEGDPGSVAQAQANAKLNNINNITCHTANLFETHYNKDDWTASKYEKVLLDPPRAGAKEIIELIKQWQASIIVYVSCNPATMARDAALLKQHGYSLNEAGIMDMFPHTQHVEVIAQFTKD